MPLAFLATRGPLVALTAAVTLALTGCGDSSSSSGGASQTGDDSDAARVKLTQCLRDNGVDLPDRAAQGGAPAPGTIDTAKLQEAMNGPCKSLQAEAFGEGSGVDRQEMQDAFQVFAQCMRDKGIDVPDITAGSGIPNTAGQIDQDDPKVRAALEQCQDKLPQAPAGGQ